MDITVQELKEKMDRKDDFIFIDVREPYEYQDFNLGAELIPLGDLMGKIGKYADQKDKEVVVHCRSGARSGMAKQMMMQDGFQNVRNLLGGVIAWQEAFSAS
jgi:rhodanese-related sulfurtransferase